MAGAGARDVFTPGASNSDVALDSTGFGRRKHILHGYESGRKLVTERLLALHNINSEAMASVEEGDWDAYNQLRWAMIQSKFPDRAREMYYMGYTTAANRRRAEAANAAENRAREDRLRAMAARVERWAGEKYTDPRFTRPADIAD